MSFAFARIMKVRYVADDLCQCRHFLLGSVCADTSSMSVVVHVSIDGPHVVLGVGGWGSVCVPVFAVVMSCW